MAPDRPAGPAELFSAYASSGPARRSSHRGCFLSSLGYSLLLSTVGLLAPGAAGAQEVVEWKAGAVEVDLTVRADSLRLRLPSGWIRPSMFRLTREDTLLTRGMDYLLDPRAGSLRLLRRFPEGARLHASYRCFPVPLRGETRAHALVWGQGAANSETAKPEEGGVGAGESSSPARLQISGSKTFAVEVGSRQDLALTQSLDLSVNGKVGRDVNVRAVLTDRNTPLQPEGTSARLEDLDRILVEVAGPRANMTLGDFRLTVPATEFSRYARQLQGARGEVAPSMLTVSAFGATTPGALTRFEFLGQEGKQGPYGLGAGGGASERVIVAGSERVVLDGQPLTRGEGEDYIIDYAQGTLTFTSRRPISAYSEITVDCQLAVDRYRRFVYGGGSAWNPKSAATPVLRALLITEGDSQSRPLVPLTDSQTALLRRAGDDTTGLGSGVHYAGLGRGDYDRITVDSLAVSFFRYMGPDSGSYQVGFIDVGEGKGDYRDSTAAGGRTAYVYRGARKGRFLPAEALAPPRRASLFCLNGAPQLGDRLALRGELAWSDFDANTLSAKDDGDNNGAAFSVEGGCRSVPLGPLRLGLQGRWRQIDARFHPLDPLDPSFYTRDWSVDPARLLRGDRRRSLTYDMALGRSSLKTTVEDLDNRIDFQARRVILETQGAVRAFTFSGRLLRAGTRDDLNPVETRRGERQTEGLTAGWSGRWVGISGRYARERNAQGGGAATQGEFFREGGGAISSGSRWSRGRIGLDWRRRLRWRIANGQDSRLDTGDTGQLTMDWQGENGGLVSLAYVERSLRPDQGGARERSQMGQIRWAGRWRADAIVQEGRWELSSSERQSRLREVRYVGLGGGHYDSLGVYQGVGNYEVFYRTLADSIKVQRIEFSLRSELDLSRWGGTGAGASSDPEGTKSVSSGRGSAWLRTLRLVHYWTAHLESDRPVSEIWPVLLPSLLGRKDQPQLEVQMRADVSALQRARWFSPGVHLEWRRSLHTAQLGSGDAGSSSLASLLLRSRPGRRWSAEQQVEREKTETSGILEDRQGISEGWRSFRLRLEQQVELGKGASLGLEAWGRQRRRIDLEEKASVWVASPFLVWSPEPRSRVELRTSRTWVERSGGDSYSRELEHAGWDSRVLATIRLREELDLSCWLRERRPDHQPVVRDGRVEVRATF